MHVYPLFENKPGGVLRLDGRSGKVVNYHCITRVSWSHVARSTSRRHVSAQARLSERRYVICCQTVDMC
jgi:hypothetical protein